MNDGLLVGLGFTQAIALFISVTFITYVALIVVPYARHRPGPVGTPTDFDWHFFVPARDEAAVIGRTLSVLRQRFPSTHVWVVDDASVDDTAAIVAAVAGRDDFVHLVRRVAPNARTGKGDALNAAYAALDRFLQSRAPSHTRKNTVVAVFDADGLPAANCLEVVAAPHLLGRDEVGAVQICVRMVNRDDPRPFPDRGRAANLFGRLLVRMQDLEFRAPISAIQMVRQQTRTVGLGGNGQFTRLSALDDVAAQYGQPWHGSLLEDYELSLHLLMAGHQSEYAMDTLVDQEGLPSMRRLLTQRTRWGQGTMQCGSYLGGIWSSRHVTMFGALEASYYLLQPWLQLLGSVIYPVPLIVLAYNIVNYPTAMTYFFAHGGWMLLVFYLVFGLTPFVLWGPLYARRCEPGIGWWRSLGYGLTYAAFIFTFYVTCWRAFYRILRGRRGWAKTRRNVDVTPGPVALEA